MTVVCPSCNGIGYRPGKFVVRERRGAVLTRLFEADQCLACKGKGTQLTFDPYVPINPAPFPSFPVPTWSPNTSSSGSVKN